MQSIKPILPALILLLSTGAHCPVYAQDTEPKHVPGDYMLMPEDILQISVWKEETLKREVVITPDGKISFPLAGHMQAAGRTVEELEAEIIKRIADYIPDAVVNVAVARVSGNKIYVIGKAIKPGEYTIGRYIDVMQALSLAGGLTPFAASNSIKILRRENGEEVTLPFKYAEVEAGLNLHQNVLLRGGDVVVIP